MGQQFSEAVQVADVPAPEELALKLKKRKNWPLRKASKVTLGDTAMWSTLARNRAHTLWGVTRLQSLLTGLIGQTVGSEIA